MEKKQVEELKSDVIEKFKEAEKTFTDAPEENRELLREFSFICLLSFDVYVKKLIIEKMIDEFAKDSSAKGRKAGAQKDGGKTQGEQDIR